MKLFVGTDARLMAKITGSLDTPQYLLPKQNSVFDKLANYLLREYSDYSLQFPVYNFDFTTLGKSNSFLSSVTTGAFNLFFYRNYAEWQTSDPVFTVCGRGVPSTCVLYDGMTLTPYGDNSIFEAHAKESFTYLSIGIGMAEIATLMHFVETKSRSGPVYRYYKTFRGTHCVANAQYDVYLRMHCRPKGVVLDYDVARINLDLLNSGLVSPHPNLPFTFFSRVPDMYEYLLERMNNDPYYLLTPSSRSFVEPLVDQLGRPFLAEDFE